MYKVKVSGIFFNISAFISELANSGHWKWDYEFDM